MDRPNLAGSFLFEGFRLERWGLSRLGLDGVAEVVALGSRALDLLLLLVRAPWRSAAERHNHAGSLATSGG